MRWDRMGGVSRLDSLYMLCAVPLCLRGVLHLAVFSFLHLPM